PDRHEQVGYSGGTREQRRPGEADNHLGQGQNREQADQPHDLDPAGGLRQQVGEGEGDGNADHCHHDGEHERETKHAAEKGREEAAVVVEHEVGRIEAALLAPEEAHRDHGRERDHEEQDQHRRREGQRRVVGDAARRLAPHSCTTTQLSAGRMTLTSAPAAMSPRWRGVVTATSVGPPPTSTNVSIVPPRTRTKVTLRGRPESATWLSCTSSGRIETRPFVTPAGRASPGTTWPSTTARPPPSVSTGSRLVEPMKSATKASAGRR